MTIEFKVGEGESASSAIMEQAAAIWKHYKTTDEVQELVDYLQIAINARRVLEDREIEENIGPRRYFDQQVFPTVRR